MYKIVELFAGCGGLGLGFKQAEFEIIKAYELEKDMVETYNKNIGNHCVKQDLTKLDFNDISDCDGIIGGSLCKGFSNNNRVNDFKENPKNLLTKIYVDIVKFKKPKFFLLENVPQLETKYDGVYFKYIMEELSNEYNITKKILCAADYGVPQKRKRLIIVGIKKDIKLNYNFPEPQYNETNYLKIKDAFENLNDNIPNQTDYSKSNKETIYKFSLIPQGGNYKNLLQEFKLKGCFHNLYKRFHLEETAITITNARKSMFIHPTENRLLSIRELARIQSFPDDFIFYGNLTSKYEMLGNAVPPKLSYEIAKELKIQLDKNLNNV